MEINVKVTVEIGESSKLFVTDLIANLLGSIANEKTSAAIAPTSKSDTQKAETKQASANKAEKTKKEVAPEPEKPQAESSVNLEEVRGYTANLLKSNPAIKTSVTELLAKHGVKKVAELTGENLEAFFNDVKALEEDVI